LVKEEAKEALYGHISNSSIPYSDFKHCMMNIEALNLDTYKNHRNKILVYKTISLFVHIKETINR
jgi:hypothetical protein